MTDATDSTATGATTPARSTEDPTAREFLDAAIQRAGNSDVIAAFSGAVLKLLEEGEVVLEAAETTAPGHLTALFATNRRVILFENLDTIREARYSTITHLSGTTQGDMALELSIFDRTVKWEGFGERGLRRIINAFVWAKHQYAPHGGTRMPEHKVGDIFREWITARRGLNNRGEVSSEEFAAAIRPITENKRWW